MSRSAAKIEFIGIVNYRTHKESLIRFKAFNRLSGERGRGKTSVLLAMALGLCSQNDYTAANGAGMESQVRRGTKAFEIVIKFIDVNNRKRTVTLECTNEGDRTITLSEFNGGVNQTKDEILRAFGARKEVILAALDPRPYSARKVEDNVAQMLTVVQKADNEIELEPALMELLKKHLKVESIATLDGIDGLYKSADDKRAAKARDQKAIQPGPEPTERPKKTEKEYIADQAAWSNEAVRLAGRIGEITATLNNHERAVARSKEPPLQKPEPLEPLSEEARRCVQETATVQAEYDGATAEYKRIKAKKAKMDGDTSKSDKVCDECGTMLTPAKRKQYSDRLGHDLAALELKGKALVSKLSDLKAKETEAYKQEEDRKSEWTTYRAWESRNVVPDPIDEDALKAEKAAAEEAKGKATRNQTKATESAALARAVESYDAKMVQIRGIASDLEDLEILCEKLGKKGIRKKLFTQWAEPFIDAMNEVTVPIGMKCSLDIDLGVLSDAFIPAMRSKGDLVFFEVAYRRAIAIHSGFGVLCMDAPEALPESEREVLWKMLRKISEEGIQVIITDATSVVTPDVFWFDLKEGVTHITAPGGDDPQARPTAA